MAYIPLTLSDGMPERLKSFVRNVIDSHLEEFHYAICLRREDQGPKGSFQRSFAILLLAIADGSAQLLIPGNTNEGQKFKKFLRKYYPWDLDQPDGLTIEEALDFLWQDARCSLVHRLGVRVAPETNMKFGNVHSISEPSIEQLEGSSVRPHSDYSIRRGGGRTIIWIEGFYWGLRIAIQNCLSQPENWAKIDKHIEQGKFDKTYQIKMKQNSKTTWQSLKSALLSIFS